MAFGAKSPGFSVPAIACAVLLALVFLGSSATAQPSIIIEVGDTTAQPGATNTAISLFLTNPFDEVAGINVWLQLDRPDIMQFKIDTVETLITHFWDCLAGSPPNCTDSVEVDSTDGYDFTTQDLDTVVTGFPDTTGCLVSGWEFIDARSLSGLGTDLNIVGLADYFTGSVTPGIAPQSGGVLIRLLADVFMIPDTMTNRTVNILIQHLNDDHFSFSRPDGTQIGVKDTTVLDTNYWICLAYVGDVCQQWQRVSSPPADSMEIVQIPTTVIDYEKVIINDGSLTVLNGICGDANGNGAVNVADLTFLVNRLFKGGPPPSPLWVGDVNCSGGSPNVADLTYMVNRLFKGGPAPCQGPGCI